MAAFFIRVRDVALSPTTLTERTGAYLYSVSIGVYWLFVQIFC